MKLNRVLAVEDSDLKWKEVEAVLAPILPVDCELVHVKDMASAKAHILAGGWDLLILDVSLDINQSGGGQRGGQQFTGGLTLASRMHYLRKQIPTIIVTGFETFVSARSHAEQDLVLGLQDVEREMRKYLKEDVVGLVRYASNGWEAKLTGLVRSRM